MMDFSIVLALGVILGFALSVVVDYIDELHKAKKEKRERNNLTSDDLKALYEEGRPIPQRHADEPPEINNLPWSFGGATKISYVPTSNETPKVCSKEPCEYDFARERKIEREREEEREWRYEKRNAEEMKRHNALEILRIGIGNIPNDLYVAAEKLLLDHLIVKPNIDPNIEGTLPRRKGLKGLDKPFNLDETIEKLGKGTPFWEKPFNLDETSEKVHPFWESSEQPETATLHEPNKPE